MCRLCGRLALRQRELFGCSYRLRGSEGFLLAGAVLAVAAVSYYAGYKASEKPAESSSKTSAKSATEQASTKKQTCQCENCDCVYCYCEGHA